MSRKPERVYDAAKKQHYLEWVASEHVSKVEPIFDRTKDYVDELETENTKLRELVRAAWKCIHTGASCSDCRLISGGCTLQSAMRELGVEQ